MASSLHDHSARAYPDPITPVARRVAEQLDEIARRRGAPFPGDEEESWAEYALWSALTASDDASLYDPDQSDRAAFRQLQAAIDDDRASRAAMV